VELIRCTRMNECRTIVRLCRIYKYLNTNRFCRFSSHGTGLKPIAIFWPIINRLEMISVNQLDTPNQDGASQLSSPKRVYSRGEIFLLVSHHATGQRT